MGVAGSNPALEYPESNVPPGPDEMLETITPHQRGNTLDPEVRNPAFRAGRGHEVEREVNMREVVEMLKKTRGVPKGYAVALVREDRDGS